MLQGQFTEVQKEVTGLQVGNAGLKQSVKDQNTFAARCLLLHSMSASSFSAHFLAPCLSSFSSFCLSFSSDSFC